MPAESSSTSVPISMKEQTVEVAKSRHNCSSQQAVMVSFDQDDPSNPYCFSKAKKLFIAGTVCLAMLNSNLSSSLPGGTLPSIGEYFEITDPATYVLPSTLFLLGYVVGPLVLVPLSEHFGRKPILLGSFTVYLSFNVACALAPTFPTLVTFRFFAGVGSATPISVIGGVYADLFEDPKTRGRGTAIYTTTTVVGQVLGPTIFGFAARAGWRWCFHLATIIGGVTIIPLSLISETYAPRLVMRKGKQLRCSSNSCGAAVLLPLEQDSSHNNLENALFAAFTRPFRMLFTEAIVAFSSIYVSFVFAVLFFFFSAYPVIFRQAYGMSVSISGLAFIPMALGVASSMVIFISYERYLEVAAERGAAWAHRENMKRLPLACMGGPLLSVSLFWLGWTASPHIHWIVPMLSGFPFAVGMMMIFVSFFNYLTDAYVVYSASALAAASCCRSVWAALLPMAASPMFSTLGIGWSTSVVGFFSICLIPVPFVFIRYGDHIRANSKFCSELKRNE